ACGHGTPGPGPDAGMGSGLDPAGIPRVVITMTVGSTRFVTREHMLAAGEMQISGEPLAEAMGRDLGAYSRDFVPADVYQDTALDRLWVDLPGFSSGIESYEYSKQPMNNLAFESGAGTALAYGPLINPTAAPGAAALAPLADAVQHFGAGSHATGLYVFAPGTFPTDNPGGATNPAGVGQGADNPLGWPGIWPTNHVFASFDPAIQATTSLEIKCSISSDDNPVGVGGSLLCADYECDATTLHLPDRAAQVDPTITPGADGFSAWKYGLWVINYLQVMHDVNETALVTVDDADIPLVGTPDNTVVGLDDAGQPGLPGTFLGSSNVEGFQAQMFLLEADNRAEDWVTRLTTTDGAALSGFASRAAALGYDYAAPLRWFPGRIAVTETADPVSGFPQPGYAIASPDSASLDLIGLAMGYAELYALTDQHNEGVGGAPPARVMFDGDPFAADNQLADGEATLHDRALAVIRAAIVSLDRVHGDPASQLLVDTVAMTGGAPVRGHTIATPWLAYTLLGLRTVRRSLAAQLQLYSNNTPDSAAGPSPLDALPLHFPGQPALTFTQRLGQLIDAQAALLYDHLTDASGRAWRGWDVAAGAPVDDADVLDAHTAAVRGLFAAFLATGDVRYRTRAIAVFARIEHVFYDPVARVYSETAAPVDEVEYTPLRFALLQSALRDMYELVAARPGGEPLEPVIEDRIGRLNKLVLNGWDDRDHDLTRASFEECANQTDQFPHGGLQMAERTLTGEFGSEGEHIPHPFHTVDRDLDCVPEVDDAHLPAMLAGSVTLHIARPGGS
ncbi:MAG TPA: hypothetical protein VK601_22065, partial [Kofleriaceae bacterium]|nr:hypothetical protein [Kofleriaceae bacterium]